VSRTTGDRDEQCVKAGLRVKYSLSHPDGLDVRFLQQPDTGARHCDVRYGPMIGLFEW
jgi:hypothetical protein